MGVVRVELLNWEDSLERKDRKNFTWFKFQNKFFGDQTTFQMNDAQRVLFLYIQCEASKKGSGTIELLTEFVAALLQRPEESITNDLNKLSELRLITGITPAQRLPREEKRREEKTEQKPENKTPATEVAIEPASEIYDYDDPSVTVPAEERPLPKLAVLWNQHADELLSRVKICSASRRKHAANRWKEHPQEEFWTDVIWKINRSDFCLGKTKNQRPWKADFDFLVRPDTAAKVLEGKYDNRGPGNPPPQPSFWARQEGKNGS